MKTKLFSLVAAFAVLGFYFTGAVSAVGKPADFPEREFSPKPLVSPRPTFSPKPESSERPFFSPKPKESSEDGRVNSCQARVAGIKTRSESLVRMANNMLTKFDAIVLGVESFYTGKVVPSGKTLSNYPDLVKDVQAKKAAVQKPLSMASSDLANFTCSSGEAKTLLLKFNQDMRDVKSALADYRTSIKNLIVAVHGLSGDEGKTEPSKSPKATFRPVKTPFGTLRPEKTFFPVGKRSPGPAVNPL